MTSINQDIVTLATLIGDIAYKCWHDLGTDASTRIQISANEVVKQAAARIPKKEARP